MDITVILCIILLPISIAFGYWRARNSILLKRFGPAVCAGLYSNPLTRLVTWVISTALTVYVAYLVLVSLGLDLEQTFTQFLFGVIVFFRILISTGLASKALQSTFSYETLFEGSSVEEQDN